MPRSDRFLKGTGHLKIPVGLVMVTELDFQYGPICKNLASDEEKTAVGVLALAGATFSIRPIPFCAPSDFTCLPAVKTPLPGTNRYAQQKKAEPVAPLFFLTNE